MISSQIDFDDLVETARRREIETNVSNRGIAEYLGAVTNDPAFETELLSLGRVLAVGNKL